MTMGQLLFTLGTNLTRQQKLDRAHEVLTEAIEILSNQYGAEHFRTALAMTAMADLQIERQQYEQAATWLERSRAIFENTKAPEPPKAWSLARDKLQLRRPPHPGARSRRTAR